MYGIISPSALPASRRRRARMDNHAAAQASYRKKLKANCVPDREDVAIAALTVALMMVNNDPANEVVAGMRRAIIGELVCVGFNRDQALRRFDGMVENIHEDRAKRQRYREWETARAAERAASDRGDGSPGGAV
ncbi:MAG: hypothetical protein HYX37_01700 [Rhizobiales bacterium]|nr:hypothetical protein [Hyphomicrobiales bacterium]